MNFRFTLLLMVCLVASNCGGETEKKEVDELRKIAAQTPMYPGFKATGEKVVLKQGMVYFFTYYEAAAKFSDVKAFYDRALKEQGWGPPQAGRSLVIGEIPFVSYRRGDYVIDVEENQQSNSFSIVFIWDPK